MSHQSPNGTEPDPLPADADLEGELCLGETEFSAPGTNKDSQRMGVAQLHRMPPCRAEMLSLCHIVSMLSLSNNPYVWSFGNSLQKWSIGNFAQASESDDGRGLI